MYIFKYILSIFTALCFFRAVRDGILDRHTIFNLIWNFNSKLPEYKPELPDSAAKTRVSRLFKNLDGLKGSNWEHFELHSGVIWFV